MSAQFVFVKNKEYKVVNWIDGNVYFSTFSAAGRESDVRSEKTKTVVMAALVEAAHAEALKMNILIDHAEIAEDSATTAAAWRDHINSPEVMQERFAEYSPKFKKHFIDRSHDDALRMNEGIDIAMRVLTCLKGAHKAEDSVAGCLIRDGYHEVNYLVQVAARKHAQRGTAEITTHGI